MPLVECADMTNKSIAIALTLGFLAFTFSVLLVTTAEAECVTLECKTLEKMKECEAQGKLWQAGRCITTMDDLTKAAGEAIKGAAGEAKSEAQVACEAKGNTWTWYKEQCRPVKDMGNKDGGQNVCTVHLDGAVYDKCGGGGEKIDDLAAGTPGVALLGKEGEHWYNVKWAAGQGCVYSGPGYPEDYPNSEAITCP
jgi:hypothetical protein